MNVQMHHTANQVRAMMPQMRYLDSVGNIMAEIEKRASAGKNSLTLTKADNFGIVDIEQWGLPGTTQIGLVIAEFKRLGFTVTESYERRTSIHIIW